MTVLSHFPNATSAPDGRVDLGMFWNALKNPSQSLKASIALIRKEADHKKKQAMKARMLPAVTVSGTFDGKGNDHLQAHSGFYIYDFDHLPDPLATRQAILDSGLDCYVGSFVSPSGDGLKVVLQGPVADAETHARAWRTGKHLLEDATGEEVDVAEDVSRLCYFSDCSQDGALHLADFYEPFVAGPVREVVAQVDNDDGVTLDDIPAPTAVKAGRDEVRDILWYCGSNLPYNDWKNLILATIKELGNGEDVVEMLREWSTSLGGERGSWTRADERTFTTLCKNADLDEGIGIASMRKFAAERGWVWWRSAIRTKLVKGVVVPLACEENVEIILTRHPELRGRLWCNAITGNVHLDPKPGSPFVPSGCIVDVGIGFRIVATLQAQHRGLKVGSPELFESAVQVIGRERMRNPRAEWLRSLTWDGTERIKHLFTQGFGAAVNPLNEATAETWMIGVAARTLTPGIDFQLVPVLIGDQGVGKSKGLEALCPASDWFVDRAIDMHGGTDSYETLRAATIVEIAELASYRRAEADAVKQFISMRSVSYRRKYARADKQVLASWAFVATTNEPDYLSDITGNRRFVSIDVVGREGNYAKTVAWVTERREQLWAEAVAKCAGRHEIVLPQQYWQASRERNASHTVVDMLADDVARYTAACAATGAKVHLRDVATAVGVDVTRKSDQMALGARLRRCGWSRDSSHLWRLEPEL